MDFLKNVVQAPPDPILGINLAFAADSRSDKLNASVGTYRQNDLQPYIFPSVKEAERVLFSQEKNKEYLPIAGEADYLKATQQLVFGQADLSRICGMQAVGGTGALRLTAEILSHAGLNTLYLGEPTWGNHQNIFTTVGFQIRSFPYFDFHTHRINFAQLCEQISKMQAGSALLLQASCHNPTGCDFSKDEWKEILRLIQRHQLFVVFDLAYQGFGEGLEEDVWPIRLFVQEGVSCAVAVSHSKTFGVYAERVGALFMVCASPTQAEIVLSRIKVIARRAYSNPPCHGARVIKTLLQTKELKALWEKELQEVRQRIASMRQLLVSELSLHLKQDISNFSYLLEQKGMFAFVGISSYQVETLKKKYGIYLTEDGRINLGGVNAQAVQTLVRALAQIPDIQHSTS
ncbi:MAG: aspartate/tyrosine/aromatic aminotransferase [Verrucomicrobia bacterium]|nr:aspartate/tyrosine/aromatic aminotransferase [Verrucomicrobiota bacterium]MBS0646150.1 aspartate/tyrosine/aromatic aminotransferase [Verrucomicrobiota bacterium]